jgi:hypothetical protein
MPDQKLSGLAAAFRTAVAREEAERKAQTKRENDDTSQAKAHEAKRIADAQAARASLIDELVEFGKSLSIVKVSKTKTGVRLTRADHALAFTIAGEEDRLDVKSPATTGSYVERDVTGDWLLTLTNAGNTRYLQLVTDGLEELLVVSLGFPRPETPAPAEAPSPVRIAADSSAPRKPLPDPEDRGTIDPNRPPPGSRVKDLNDPFS